MMPTQEARARLVEAFVVLQLVGCALFVLILVLASIAQRRGASRHPTFFSFCISWIIFCVSYALLAFAGQQTVPPNHWLCITQAAFVYGAPPLASSATVCLVTHLMLNIQVAFSHSVVKRRSALVSILLVVTPWVTWLAVTAGVLIFSIYNRQFVMLSPNGTFCILVRTALPRLTSIWAAVASVILIAEELMIGILLYRNRDRISGVRQSAAMALRVAIFTLAGTTSIVIAFYYVSTSQRGVELDVLLATMPVFSAVIFGSQKDIVSVLAFWERRTTTATVVPTVYNHTGVLTTIVASHGTIHDASVPGPPTLADHGHESATSRV